MKRNIGEGDVLEKPKQFWIGSESLRYVYHNMPEIGPRTIHVIEYSAYDALHTENERLKAILGIAQEALVWVDEMFTARDEMNAKVHCAPLRLSPITERVKQARAALEPKPK